MREYRMIRKSTDRHQLQLPIPLTWGGRRPGAGRKPNGARAGVSHTARPAHLPRHPVHATLPALPGVGSLRAAGVFPQVRAALALCRRTISTCSLTTPREVRHALVYILINWKKHRPDSRGIVAASRTWLGRDGWRRHGRIAVEGRPLARTEP